MSTNSTTSTNYDYSVHCADIKTKKPVVAQNIFYSGRVKKAESVSVEPNMATGLLVEYLDIPTFLRRGVALSDY